MTLLGLSLSPFAPIVALAVWSSSSTSLTPAPLTSPVPVPVVALTAPPTAPLQGGLAIPSNGWDGALTFMPDTPGGNVMTIDLSQAEGGVGTGLTWSSTNRAPGKGVYDYEKWAVVFHYTSVTIPSGKQLQFSNHPSTAPVVWLVDGDVTLDGFINLDGNSTNYGGSYQAIPGPGGFRGGTAQNVGAPQAIGGSGLGPGGGRYTTAYDNPGSGSYATAGINSLGETYGNTQILPLVGGSGGGTGWRCGSPISGAAGGGAILIASRSRITLNGFVAARGGSYHECNYGYGSAAGAGGAVRLIANEVSGIGTMSAAGGYNAGGDGRIRIEANVYSGSLTVSPATDIVLPNSPPLIWPLQSGPTARIVSIGAVNAPIDPNARVMMGTADVLLPDSGTTPVLVECTGIPVGPGQASVQIRLTPRIGFTSLVPASLVSGTQTLSTWVAHVNLPNGFHVMQVRATYN